MRRILTIAAVAGLFGLGYWWDNYDRRLTAPASGIPRSPILVSAETTVVTEPLDAHGYLDVVEAINRRGRRGITPDTNAAVTLLEALGPRQVPSGVSSSLYAQMEMAPLPPDGVYYVPLFDYGVSVGLENEELDDLIGLEVWSEETPWRGPEFAGLADWVEQNDAVLDLVVSTVGTRARFFAPLIPGEGPAERFEQATAPLVSAFNTLARGLDIRAMGKIGEKNFDSAARDLLAHHRLARLCSRQQPWSDTVQAYAMELNACRADIVLAAAPDLPVETARWYALQLAELPPLGRMQDRIDFSLRLGMVDLTNSLVQGVASAKASDKGFFSEFFEAPAAPPDYNTLLRVTHDWIDRLVAASRLPTARQQDQALLRIQSELNNRVQEAETPRYQTRRYLMSPQQFAAATATKLAHRWVASMIDVVRSSVSTEHRTAAQVDMVRVALALAVYRKEQGSYPDRLEQLEADWMGGLPLDRFSGKPLVYRPIDDGYLLYSVGPNFRDDQGTTRETAKLLGHQDYDLVVEVPIVFVDYE